MKGPIAKLESPPLYGRDIAPLIWPIRYYHTPLPVDQHSCNSIICQPSCVLVAKCKGVHSLMPDLGCLWLIADLLQLRPGFHQGCNSTRWAGEIEWVRMNLVVIEEHQVGDLVFAQVNYLYIQLKATPAYLIVPIAKVPQTKYNSCQ